ncbi:hypothetical protein [Metallosphaera hakonensis]|nr:hypothetical protein [Metallosphaera hakonensis]
MYNEIELGTHSISVMVPIGFFMELKRRSFTDVSICFLPIGF